MNERESVLDSLSFSIINEGILGIRPAAGKLAGSEDNFHFYYEIYGIYVEVCKL